MPARFLFQLSAHRVTALLSPGRLRGALAAPLSLLLEPVNVEGFVPEGLREQSRVNRRVGLNRLAEARTGGGHQVGVVVSGSVHDLPRGEQEMRSFFSNERYKMIVTNTDNANLK